MAVMNAVMNKAVTKTPVTRVTKHRFPHHCVMGNARNPAQQEDIDSPTPGERACVAQLDRRTA